MTEPMILIEDEDVEDLLLLTDDPDDFPTEETPILIFEDVYDTEVTLPILRSSLRSLLGITIDSESSGIVMDTEQELPILRTHLFPLETLAVRSLYDVNVAIPILRTRA